MLNEHDPTTIGGAIAVATAIFRPEMLRPDPFGKILVGTARLRVAFVCLGFENGKLLVRDLLGGETTALFGAPYDPYVARKILSVARGYRLPVRPDETAAEAREACEPWISGWGAGPAMSDRAPVRT